jgi:hypothetical protein
MTDRLEGVRLKIDRAEFHRNALEAECIAWTNGLRATVAHEHDEVTRWHSLVVKVDPPWPDPPLNWGVIVGDLVHNLRCALDHTIWQLVIANGNTPDGGNQFPIYTHAPDAKAYDARVKGISAGAEAIVASLQPYLRTNPPKPEPLGVLADLSNIDKHRSIHSAVVVMSQLQAIHWTLVPFGPEGGDPGTSDAKVRINESVGKRIHNAEIIGVLVTPNDGEVTFEEHPKIPAQVAFGDSPKVPFSELAGLIAEVQRVVGLLEPFTK